MIVTFDDKQFLKDVLGAVNYSEGFIEGIQEGKPEFLTLFGKEVIQVLKEFVDSNARVDPQMLQHVYEWYHVGSPDARLYDVQCHLSGTGISFNYTFSQSRSIKDGSHVPFYDKARIMEDGIPVTIKPVAAQALAFDINGETVFTKTPVEISNPGGSYAKDGFKTVFDSFFSNYFTQSFLLASGMVDYLKSPFLFSKNFAGSRSGGKQLGRNTGIEFITKAATGGVF